MLLSDTCERYCLALYCPMLQCIYVFSVWIYSELQKIRRSTKEEMGTPVFMWHMCRFCAPSVNLKRVMLRDCITNKLKIVARGYSCERMAPQIMSCARVCDSNRETGCSGDKQRWVCVVEQKHRETDIRIHVETKIILHCCTRSYLPSPIIPKPTTAHDSKPVPSSEPISLTLC